MRENEYQLRTEYEIIKDFVSEFVQVEAPVGRLLPERARIFQQYVQAWKQDGTLASKKEILERFINEEGLTIAEKSRLFLDLRDATMSDANQE